MPSKKYVERYKRLGICVDCSNPIYLDHCRCLDCLIKNNRACVEYKKRNGEKVNQTIKKLREKYRLEGRCTHCSAPLDVDADEGHITCQNCREKPPLMRAYHATVRF